MSQKTNEGAGQGNQNAGNGNNPSHPSVDKGNGPKHDKLHIFINNLKYDEGDGVKPTMTGRELASLVPMSADTADITRKNSEVLIQPDEQVPIKMGDHFEIIRKRVDAGC